jgi:ABC-type multidrug transport system fused ATPase/permease subunit
MRASPEAFGGRRRKYLLRLVVNGVAQAGAAVMVAAASQRLFSASLAEPAAPALLGQTIAAPVLVFVAAIAALGWLRRRERIDAESLGQDYVGEIRIAAFDHLCRLSLRAHGKLRKGALMLRFVGDLTALRQWISLGVARLIVAGLMLAGCLIGLILLSPLVGAAVAAVAVAGGLVILAMGWRLDGVIRDARRRRGRLAAALGERLARIATTNAFARRGAERRAMKKLTRRLAGAMIARAGAVGAMRAAAQITIGLATAAALIAGALGRASGLAEPGDIVAAMSVVAIMTGSLADLGRVYEYWRGARIAEAKLARLFETGPLIMQPENPRAVDLANPAIEFHGAGVERGIENLTGRVEPGERLFITGPNGSGKSTILYLVSRLIDADAGNVTIGGEDIAAVGLGSLRRAVSIVSPEIGLFRGTVADNILYGSDERPANFDAVCALCGVDRDDPAAPLHLDRAVDEDGANLSLGERARLALARALAGAPKILLLDEADAHLDAPSRDILKRAIEQFDGTVIAVTHDPELLPLADRIWRIRDGRLIRVDVAAAREEEGRPHLAPAT